MPEAVQFRAEAAMPLRASAGSPPMTKNSGHFGENRLVRLIQQRSQFRGPSIKLGIGDDAAVLSPKGADEFWLVTTDMLVENIDFRREWTTPSMLGSKAVSVNLSDLAAMGANPRFITVSLGISGDISERWIMNFHDGVVSRCSQSGASLVGGDLSKSEKHIAISITAIGESRKRKILYRSGGKAGDILYVTGELGRSAAGLKLLLQGEMRTRARSKRTAIRAHRDPEPRCAAGIWLAQSGLVSCMMDLSDGLSMDLPRLCQASGVGAEIRSDSIPCFAESAEWGGKPLDLALHGGEDFELLFGVPEIKSRTLEKLYPPAFPKITRIGRMIPEPGKVWIITPPNSRSLLKSLGWDHFADRDRRHT